MQRLRFGKHDSNTRLAVVTNPQRIASILLCSIYQQFIDNSNRKIPLYYIYNLPVHKNLDNTSLVHLTWNSSSGQYTPCENIFHSLETDIPYSQILKIL